MACRLPDSSLFFKGSCQKLIHKRKFAAQYLPGIFNSNGNGLIQKGFRHQKYLIPRKEITIIQAVSIPVAPSSADGAEYRKQLSESYGFRQIGETLPDNVTLNDIVDSFPKSFFVIGHDCAHKSFSRDKLVEDIVGTVAFLPLIYPYEPWRFMHDRHHAKTNMLKEDTAWHPILKEEFDSSPILPKALIYAYGPFRPRSTIAHWLICHFDLKKFRPNEVKRVKISLACVFTFMAIGWPLIIYKSGITGWIKYWLMPWLGYQFWMSTFTMVHPTALHIPFKFSEDWNAAQAQLNGTFHCDYPRCI